MLMTQGDKATPVLREEHILHHLSSTRETRIKRLSAHKNWIKHTDENMLTGDNSANAWLKRLNKILIRLS